MNWLFVQVHQESNTRVQVRTDYGDFARRYWVAGPQSADAPAPDSAPGAFIRKARDMGDRVVGVFAVNAPPGGPVGWETWQALLDDLTQSLAAATESPGVEADGLILAMHGGMAVAGASGGTAPAEPLILERVRQMVGHRLPVLGLFDFHGDVGPELAEGCSVVIAHQSNPHHDHIAAGIEARRLMARVAAGEQAGTAWARIPLSLHDVHCHDDRPVVQALRHRLQELTDGDSVWRAQWFAGSPHGASPQLGPVVVVSGRKGNRLRRTAAAAVELFVEMRKELMAVTLQPLDRLPELIAADRTPLALLDLGDHTGAGARGGLLGGLGEAVRSCAATGRSLSAGVISAARWVTDPPQPGSLFPCAADPWGRVKEVTPLAAGPDPALEIHLKASGTDIYLTVSQGTQALGRWRELRNWVREADVMWLKTGSILDLPPERTKIPVDTPGPTAVSYRAANDEHFLPGCQP
ncbi:MAG: M81 family metallopeptidase [Thermaerobacterales bacterium]